jgi:hypothetical protein
MGVVLCLRLYEAYRYRSGLPMAAAVTAATTVEAATAAVDSGATVEAAVAAAAHRAATETAADCSATFKATSAATIKAAATVEATSAPTTSAPTAVEPRASADEQAAGEIARTVVAVRRAGVWVITVVTVSADRSRTDITRTDAHPYREALSAGVRREGQGRSKYRKNHETFHQMFHIGAPSEPVKPL